MIITPLKCHCFKSSQSRYTLLHHIKYTSFILKTVSSFSFRSRVSHVVILKIKNKMTKETFPTANATIIIEWITYFFLMF